MSESAGAGPLRRLLVVSPCRNEADHLRRSLDTVVAQSVRPTLWVVVDDGSSDASPAILAEYAAKLPWLRVVRRSDRGHRAGGAGVVEAFYDGLAGVSLDAFDYLCKLDLDLELPPRYFEILCQRMEACPRLGTASGKSYLRDPRTGALVSERLGDEASAGMTKFYRVACFRQIGGFVRHVGWDGIDCHTCRLRGWVARSWDEPELRFVHLRQEGSSQKSLWTGRLRDGLGQYYIGTGPLYMAASVVYRMTLRPYVVGGLGMAVGYLRSALRRLPRHGDREFRRFLRRFHRDVLLHGRSEALRRAEERQRGAWSPPGGV
jgi:glycosyltransferase involved in cell wall biosynthesis